MLSFMQSNQQKYSKDDHKILMNPKSILHL